MVAPGDIIDRYQVEADLGGGGMGTVYRVRHQALGTVHALKVPHVITAGLRARLVQEGQLQARLNHPGIVPVTDLLDVEGAPGLLMPFVSGGNLDRWIQDGHPQPIDEVRRIFLGVVEAVAAAHAAGVVHRDIKPANIVLDGSPDRPHPRVTDFGIAKLLVNDPGFTRSGVTVGTVAYMPPEQLWDAKYVDERADIYALGCLLFEMLTGRRAYQDAHPAQDDKVRNRDMSPGLLRPEVPDDLNQIVRRCLAYNREDRYPSCDALLRALRGEPSLPAPSTRPDTRPAPTPLPTELPMDLDTLPPIKSAPSWLIPAVLVGMTAAIGVVVFALSGSGASAEPPPPVVEPVAVAAPAAVVVPPAPPAAPPPPGEEVTQTEAEAKARAEAEAKAKADADAKAKAKAKAKGADHREDEAARAPGKVKIRSKPVCPFTFNGAAHGADWYVASVPAGAYTVSFNCGDGRMADLPIVVKPNETTDVCWDFGRADTCLR